MGRKRTYDRATIIAEVCERLAKGEPLAVICRDAHMPDPSTIWDWEKQDESVAQSIARARDDGADAIAAECLDIADTPPAFKTSDGGSSIDQGDVANRKLRIETRLKLLAKWNPRKYGDKVELSGPGEGGALLVQAITGVPSADAAD